MAKRNESHRAVSGLWMVAMAVLATVLIAARPDTAAAGANPGCCACECFDCTGIPEDGCFGCVEGAGECGTRCEAVCGAAECARDIAVIRTCSCLDGSQVCTGDCFCVTLTPIVNAMVPASSNTGLIALVAVLAVFGVAVLARRKIRNYLWSI